MRGLPWRRIARIEEGLENLEVTDSGGSGFLAGSTSPSSRARARIIAVLSHYPRQIVRQKLMGADSSICVGPERTLGDKKRIQIVLGFQSGFVTRFIVGDWRRCLWLGTVVDLQDLIFREERRGLG